MPLRINLYVRNYHIRLLPRVCYAKRSSGYRDSEFFFMKIKNVFPSIREKPKKAPWEEGRKARMCTGSNVVR